MLTILFATRNRASLLRQVLESYRSLQAPASGWKLVVVNNGSTDETAQVLEAYAKHLPLQFLIEPRPGKNIALNSGLELIEGGLTVLTDDDAFPHREWLVHLQTAADGQPGYSMFGGAIVARWAKPPQPWVAWLNQAAAYTITNPSLKDGPLDPREIYGPNMAVRSDVFRSGVRFDMSIGPRGASYPMGSETELVLRLGRLGHKAWHVQHSVVEHFIREEQLEKTWVMHRAVRFGRGQYRLFHADAGGKSRRWPSVPPYLWRKMLKQGALMAMARVTFQEEMFFRANWRFNCFWGEATEARILAREHGGRETSAAAAERREP